MTSALVSKTFVIVLLAALVLVAGCAAEPDDNGAADARSVAPPREIHPDDWAETYAQCLRDAGFDAEASRDGGVELAPVPDDQAQRLEDVGASCDEAYPIAARYDRRLEDHELTFLYEYYTTELIPCLEGHGYEGFSPPSLAEFIEIYYTEENWGPYVDLGSPPATENEYYGLVEACPQLPPLDELYTE